jgi:hypothetical protein
MEQRKMSRYFNKKSKNAEVVDNNKEKDNSKTPRTSDTDTDMAIILTTTKDKEKSDSALPNENISSKTTTAIEESSANITANLENEDIDSSSLTCISRMDSACQNSKHVKPKQGDSI